MQQDGQRDALVALTPSGTTDAMDGSAEPERGMDPPKPTHWNRPD